MGIIQGSSVGQCHMGLIKGNTKNLDNGSHGT